MRQYHHLGIPTAEVKPGERYLAEYDTYISGFESSEFGIEWMRFGPAAKVPELVRTVPHVAFQVDDLEKELEGRQILIKPNSPSKGVRVAFVVENGAPVEFLEFETSDKSVPETKFKATAEAVVGIGRVRANPVA